MGIFDKFKKDKVIDYTEQYRYSIRKKSPQTVKTSANIQDSGEMGFLNDFAQSAKSDNDFSNSSLNSEERKEKLKQRLLNMTTQLEDLSNQIYRLNQRIEFLEQKLKSRSDYLG